MPGGLHPPIATILSWPVPNYVNPPTRDWGVPILVIILLSLCYIVVGLRLWTRLVLAKNFGYDDALIIFNMLPLTGEAICLILAFRLYGFSHHVWDNPPAVLIQSRKITVALEATYLVSTATTKISILLFYRRLAVDAVTKRFLYAVYAAIGFVVAYFIVFFTNLFVGCQPFNAFWNQVNLDWIAEQSPGTWKCFDEALNLIAAACISVVQDFIACFMPMVLFWKLRIRMKQKIALAAIFGVGFFLCICGILRVTSTVPIYFSTYDMTWESRNAWIWFAIESHMAVVCASAPALNYFFRHAANGTSFSSYIKSSFTRSSRDRYFKSKSSSNSASQGYRSELHNSSSCDALRDKKMDNYPKDSGHDVELIEKNNEVGKGQTERGKRTQQEGFDVSWLGDISSESEMDVSSRDLEQEPWPMSPPTIHIYDQVRE